ncbi:hypothetical protein M0R45_034861 [Rubus argutus]|uniref:Uncharacterized protein n=1 Tax=Rubus argutus TaxID=59490 RepID=A0AAW1VVS2_RUBAR
MAHGEGGCDFGQSERRLVDEQEQIGVSEARARLLRSEQIFQRRQRFLIELIESPAWLGARGGDGNDDAAAE